MRGARIAGFDPEATVLSIDGISAFDLVSRAAMLRGLSGVSGGQRAIPFVTMFLWRTIRLFVGR